MMSVYSLIEDYGNDMYGEYDLTILKRDEYYLNFINNSTKQQINVFSTYEECIKV